jgi:hypothetical protein
MSLLRRSLIAASLSVLLVPALASAQCHGGGSQSSMQTRGRASLRGQLSQGSVLNAVNQANNLQTLLGPGFNLQATGSLQLTGRLTAVQQQAALQTALAQTTNLLSAAQQQGGSARLINQLAALQQQIATLLTNLQVSAAVPSGG